MPTATIYQNLKHIVEDPSPPPKFPVAALTTENRDTWANIRRALQAEPGNEEALRLIDSAIFVLCLDDHGVESVADVTRTFLHGDGTNRLDMSWVAEIVSIETTIIILDKIKWTSTHPPSPPQRNQAWDRAKVKWAIFTSMILGKNQIL